MGNLSKVFCVLMVITSCNNPSLQLDTRNLASNFNAYQTPPSKATKKSTSKEGCLYQEINYDQAFIDKIDAFEKIYWDPETNHSYIDLQNKDQVVIQQEGCEYYSIEFNWLKAKDTHALHDITYWLGQTKWLYNHLLESYALDEFTRLCEDENYHYSLKDNTLTLNFTNHEFSEWYLKIHQTASGETTLRTGYYYK